MNVCTSVNSISTIYYVSMVYILHSVPRNRRLFYGWSFGVDKSFLSMSFTYYFNFATIFLSTPNISTEFCWKSFQHCRCTKHLKRMLQMNWMQWLVFLSMFFCVPQVLYYDWFSFSFTFKTKNLSAMLGRILF